MEIGESCADLPQRIPAFPKFLGISFLIQCTLAPAKMPRPHLFYRIHQKYFQKFLVPLTPKSKQKKPCPADALHIRRAGPSIVFYSFPCEMLHQRFPDYEILNAHGPRADFVFIEAHDYIAVLIDVELLVVGNPLEAFVRHFRRRHKVRPLLRVLLAARWLMVSWMALSAICL